VEYIKDPYTRKKTALMSHQEYRTIKIGPTDLLKNGQMIQVSVCDPFDDSKFHPTDKVIIAKHNEQHYACGSFCGFDFTNLATGALLGEKLVCPTCGSAYNITSGFVDQGPSLRNISSFLVQTRDNKVQMIIPEHVPAFAKKKYLKRQNIDPRTFVVLGDSETALSAVDSLRTSFTGRVVVIPTSPFGQFENTDILNRKFSPISKNEAFMVEEDYFERANIDIVKGELKSIDLQRNEITVKGLKDRIHFDKVMIAWGSYKKRLSKDYSNVFYLEDRHSHARCHNEMLKAKSIVVLGGTFEAFQTAASMREYLDSIYYKDVQISIIHPEMSEIQ
jgi:nitrite reductase/ring-hydroxylating ferredoxin subunit